MARKWKTKRELCELAARLRFSGGAGPQSVDLQAEAEYAKASAWFDVLPDVIHLWAEESRADATTNRVLELSVQVMQATAAMAPYTPSTVRPLADIEVQWAEAVREWMDARGIPLNPEVQ